VRPTLYLETTILSYLCARPSREPLAIVRQDATAEWWNEFRVAYELRVSDIVVDECRAGDAETAALRLAAMHGIPRLAVTDEVRDLAQRVARATGIPARASADALHIAVASVHEVDYLLTWNMRHLANARLVLQVRAACIALGYRPPTICTPEELMGD
jgi:hypothetical protein